MAPHNHTECTACLHDGVTKSYYADKSVIVFITPIRTIRAAGFGSGVVLSLTN